MNQNVSTPTVIIVLLMVAAILTAIWYIMFDQDGLGHLHAGDVSGWADEKLAPCSMAAVGAVTATRPSRAGDPLA